MPLPWTNDPGVVLLRATPGYVVYRDRTTGETWAEVGTCNRCGLCEIGTVREPMLQWDPTKRRGEPESCVDPDYDRRPHFVTRPTVKQAMKWMAKQFGLAGGGCSLEFEELSRFEEL